MEEKEFILESSKELEIREKEIGYIPENGTENETETETNKQVQLKVIPRVVQLQVLRMSFSPV